MAIQTLTLKNFVDMPWKNGSGVTTELFKISEDQNLNFRISIATINSDGPFSFFPNIDRTLYLFSGKGLKLAGPFGEKNLLDNRTAIQFPGEWAIDCQLIDGKCRDFNVMTNRDYAKSTISLHDILPGQTSIFSAACDLKFLYDKEDNILYKFELGDSWSIKATDKTKTIYEIDVVLL
jgi:environmental stress-induced protein Ves